MTEPTTGLGGRPAGARDEAADRIDPARAEAAEPPPMPRFAAILTILPTALIAAVIGLAIVFGADAGGSATVAASPKDKIDCTQYQGTEKEACEKMMARRRS